MPSIRKLISGNWAATAYKGSDQHSSTHPSRGEAERWAEGIEGDAPFLPAGELVARVRVDLANAAETTAGLGLDLEEWEESRAGGTLILIAYIESR